MSLDDCLHCQHLTDTVDRAYDRARAALVDQAPPLEAVTWLSAQLAATEHVLQPAIAHHLPDQAARLRALRRSSHALHRTLRALEQHAAGDGLRPRASVTGLRHQLWTALGEHAALEHDLLDRLASVVGSDTTHALARRYEHGLQHGPTRPHPHGAHRGPLERLTYAFDSARDHILDVLDSRHVPIPRRRRAPKPPGPWGTYLIGTPQPDRVPPGTDPSGALPPGAGLAAGPGGAQLPSSRGTATSS
ncbi:MAG TPA: hypothetical protein VNE21_07525 [Mycobacteriales bacterium]|nr:hypothetical protein [Mycobacteriales bacterium]